MNHRSTAKLIKISNALLIQTKRGRLAWVPTEKLDVFEVNFPDYSIRIIEFPDLPFRVTYEIGGGSYKGVAYKVEIYNNEGRPNRGGYQL